MDFRLFDAKPVAEPMLNYCESNHWEHISVKYEWKTNIFCDKKCTWKCLQNGGYFVSNVSHSSVYTYVIFACHIALYLCLFRNLRDPVKQTHDIVEIVMSHRGAHVISFVIP